MPLPLIAAAIGSGLLRTGVGLLSNRSDYQRKRDLTNKQYGFANERLHVRQGDVREGNNESLIARGMGAGGQAPGTLASQSRTDLTQQFGFEQRDLDFQRDAELNEEKANYKNGILGAISGGVQTGLNVYGAGKDLAASRAAGPAATPPIAAPVGGSGGIGTIRGAYGVDVLDPQAHQIEAGGIGTKMGTGQSNYDFRSNG